MSEWIQTKSGVKFFPFRPRMGDIRTADIAWSLARQCRFAGHCKRFYSVAQHAVWVSRYLEAHGASLEVQWWGLHHDDAEAYLPDLPSPIKRHSGMRFYRCAEEGIMRLVALKYGMDWPGPGPISVRHADRVALVTEARDLMGPQPVPWGVAYYCEPYDALPIFAVAPPRAHELWIERFDFLAKRVGYISDEPAEAPRLCHESTSVVQAIQADDEGLLGQFQDPRVDAPARMTAREARQGLNDLLRDGYSYIPCCNEYDERGQCVGVARGDPKHG